jgi:hypothetical protein
MGLELKSILLWLFVINLGIAFGAGLYEARVVIPQWADMPPKTWPNTGLMFWVYVTTVPLTLLTLANVIAAWMERSSSYSLFGAGRNILLLHPNHDSSHNFRAARTRGLHKAIAVDVF